MTPEMFTEALIVGMMFVSVICFEIVVTLINDNK